MNCKNPLFLALGAIALGACAYAPLSESPPAAPPESLTKVFFYPTRGQSAQQQDRDRYDCYVWSVDQTGFDPSRRIAPREARATVVPSPGQTLGTAAVVGAAIGAVAARPGDVIEGALIGAAAGTVVGAAAASAQQQEGGLVEARYNGSGQGRHEREAAEYRRAMSACLEGRGYSVR